MGRDILSSIASAILWYQYLKRSKRVKETFPEIANPPEQEVDVEKCENDVDKEKQGHKYDAMSKEDVTHLAQGLIMLAVIIIIIIIATNAGK
jgi:hypothetical protein